MIQLVWLSLLFLLLANSDMGEMEKVVHLLLQQINVFSDLWCMMIYSCDWFHRFPTGLLVNFRVPLKTIHFLYLRLIWPLSIKKYVLISEFSQIPVCVISRSLIKGVPFSMQTWVRWSKSCEKPHLMRARSENYHVHFMYCSKTGYMVRIDESCKQKLHHDNQSKIEFTSWCLQISIVDGGVIS